MKRLERSVLEYAIYYITECPFGTFGNNCRQECGHCLEKYHCHHINGSCLNGCLQGYRGEQCKHRKCFQSNILYLNKRLMIHIAHLNNGFLHQSISVYLYISIYFSVINFEPFWGSNIISLGVMILTIVNLNFLQMLA